MGRRNRLSKLVMPALVAGIHVFLSTFVKSWMAGTSPAMTIKRRIAV